MPKWIKANKQKFIFDRNGDGVLAQKGKLEIQQ